MSETEEYVGGTSVDLSPHVTVFVTTVGAPTFAACLAHLRAQDCRFPLRIIAGVAPMHVAFQRMLDTCPTPYFVQVDEDMLLDPDAVRSLHARMEAGGERLALYTADLYDEHLRRCIIGIKIFRHAIARRYPLHAIDKFEVHQVAQMMADGYEVVKAPTGMAPVPGQTLGRHGTRWTNSSIFERYQTLERRRRTSAGKVQWFESYAAEFVERFQREPSEENFFALMGVIAGTLSSRHGPAMAKDYRTYESLPGLAALRAFLDAFAPPPERAEPAARPAAPTRASGNGGDAHTAAAPRARA